MKYNTFFIQTYPSGEGVTVHTDTRWTIRLNDIYVNPYTELALIEYLDIHGSVRTVRTSCGAFDDIKVTQIKD